MPEARAKTALILTGGGIMGAAYEIGALTALERLFSRTFSARRFDIYLGISAGSIIATLMANRISADGLFAAISHEQLSVFNWHRHDIYQPDWRMLFTSLGELPRKLLQVRRNYRQSHWVFNPRDIPHLLFEQFPALFAGHQGVLLSLRCPRCPVSLLKLPGEGAEIPFGIE